MAESEAVKQKNPTWPVIINESLLGSNIHKALTPSHKCRLSSSTVPNSLIFPMSGVAFLLIDVAGELRREGMGPESESAGDQAQHPAQSDDATPTDGGDRNQIPKRIAKFTEVHRHCYILLQCPLYGPEEMKYLYYIQSLILDGGAAIIPSHSAMESVTCMDTIAKVHCKPSSELLKARLEDVRQKVETEGHLATLAAIGIPRHDAQMLLDGLGSLSRVLTASRQQLLHCSVDTQVADKIVSFMAGR